MEAQLTTSKIKQDRIFHCLHEIIRLKDQNPYHDYRTFKAKKKINLNKIQTPNKKRDKKERERTDLGFVFGETLDWCSSHGCLRIERRELEDQSEKKIFIHFFF